MGLTDAGRHPQARGGLVGLTDAGRHPQARGGLVGLTEAGRHPRRTKPLRIWRMRVDTHGVEPFLPTGFANAACADPATALTLLTHRRASWPSTEPSGGAMLWTLRAMLWTLRAMLWMVRAMLWTLRAMMWMLRAIWQGCGESAWARCNVRALVRWGCIPEVRDADRWDARLRSHPYGQRQM